MSGDKAAPHILDGLVYVSPSASLGARVKTRAMCEVSSFLQVGRTSVMNFKVEEKGLWRLDRIHLGPRVPSLLPPEGPATTFEAGCGLDVNGFPQLDRPILGVRWPTRSGPEVAFSPKFDVNLDSTWNCVVDGDDLVRIRAHNLVTTVQIRFSVTFVQVSERLRGRSTREA